MNLEFWAELAAQARNLKEAQEKHGALDAEKPVSEDFLDALLLFRFFLNKAFEGMGQLEQTWVASPKWRKFFRSDRMPPNDPTAHMFKIGVWAKVSQVLLVVLLDSCPTGQRAQRQGPFSMNQIPVKTC